MPEEQNLIIFIIEDVKISEHIYFEATKIFVFERVSLFNTQIMGFAFVWMIVLILFVLILNHICLISPITKLTDQIMNPGKSGEMEKFIKQIQDQAYKEKKKKEKDLLKKKPFERIPCCKWMYLEKVDEIHALRVLFSTFFS